MDKEKRRTISGDEIGLFEEKYQLPVSLLRLNDITVVYNVIRYTNHFYGNIELALNQFTACCLARHKHKTLEIIGLLICDLDQLFSIMEYFCHLTKDYEDVLAGQTVGLTNEAVSVHRIILKMLKYLIMPPVNDEYVKSGIQSAAEALGVLALDVISYTIQRLLAFVAIKKSNQLLYSFAKVMSTALLSRKKKFTITSKLEYWLGEKSICERCSRPIGVVPCVKEVHSKRKWHMGCSKCDQCGRRLFAEDLNNSFGENDLILCEKCASKLPRLESLSSDNVFMAVSSRQQAILNLKSAILEVVQELEGDDYGYICQEWVKYWRMDSEDLARFDRKEQKVQSAIFELIHRQQFFVDLATEFLKYGDKFLADASQIEGLDAGLYDIVFKPVKELRKIHKRLLLSPMTRFLADQGMVIKNLIFKLYLYWINKSHYAYEDYLCRLAESKLLQDLDTMREIPYFQNWIAEQKSTNLEKSLSGGFYYQLIQTKDIMKSLEKVLDKENPENTIVYQTSMLVDKYSFQLHAVLDRAVTRAYINRIQNLEVKRADVHYEKHAFVKYKNKVANEIVDCCLIKLNMCLVITKLSIATGTFIKFAPLIYVDNLEYERVDNKVLVSDRSRRELEVFKFHFTSEEDARRWVQ